MWKFPRLIILEYSSSSVFIGRWRQKDPVRIYRSCFKKTKRSGRFSCTDISSFQRLQTVKSETFIVHYGKDGGLPIFSFGKNGRNLCISIERSIFRQSSTFVCTMIGYSADHHRSVECLPSNGFMCTTVLKSTSTPFPRCAQYDCECPLKCVIGKSHYQDTNTFLCSRYATCQVTYCADSPYYIWLTVVLYF